jgi:membrane associated rhomboid family serine protease
MLQRIQTLLLLVVAGAMASVTALPIWEKSSATLNEKVQISAFNLEHLKGDACVLASSTAVIGVLAIVAALVAIFSITQYKKRILQMTLGVTNSVVIAVALGYTFYQVFKIGVPMFEPEAQGSYGAGFVAMVTALLANMIANRFIRRDEMLVKSSDRMR